ncbi:MAG: serine hydrolase domain-containing protein [Pseudomonadota bacterium]
MKKLVYLLVATLSSLPIWAGDAGEASQAELALSLEDDYFSVEKFNAYLDGVVSAQFNDYQLAGVTLAVVKDGGIVTKRGYGYADLVSKEPVDPDRHLFRPGSVSKLFTWTAVMQLVEQGKLDLNAPIAEYVDQFAIPDAFDTPMTMVHLMTHAPGLEDGAAGFLFSDEPEDIIPLAESLAKHTPTQVRAPGTHSAYSNWATALAGLVVANISGKSFEQYVADHIFKPLGMQQATFDEPLPERLTDDMATGYVAEQGTLKAFGFEYIKNFGPAGALSAASQDMAYFMLAHLNGGEYGGGRILSAETTMQMHSALFRHDDRVAAMAHGFYEIWRGGQRFIGHGGDTIAFHSEMVIDPENNFGVYLSTNAPEGAQARSAIINGVIDYFYGKPEPQFVYEALDDSAQRIAQVAGAYRFNRRSYTTLEGILALGGDLNVSAASDTQIFVPGDGGGSRYAEVEPYVFEKIGGDRRLVFATDNAGQVTSVFIASAPIIVGDKVGALETAANHQLVIGLALLAAIFVLINAVRNRKDGLTGGAAIGRRNLNIASLMILLFIVGFGGIVAGVDMNRVVFDFPPTGTGLVLWLPLIGLATTVVAIVYLQPVWRDSACSFWARIRYTYVCLVYALFFGVLYYWNLLGWNY